MILKLFRDLVDNGHDIHCNWIVVNTRQNCAHASPSSRALFMLWTLDDSALSNEVSFPKYILYRKSLKLGSGS